MRAYLIITNVAASLTVRPQLLGIGASMRPAHVVMCILSSSSISSEALLVVSVPDRDGCAVFFFQAEDGIRDVAVTGVQTCALPIYWLRGSKPEKAKGRKVLYDRPYGLGCIRRLPRGLGLHLLLIH